MKWQEWTWINADKIEILAREWLVDQPRAVICLIHGFGEHSQRYHHFAAFFEKAGIATMAIDLRGHGRSGGTRGHSKSVDAFMDDVAQLLVEAEVRHPSIPIFLYGHSMGGNLVLNYLLRRNPVVEGVIASAPWLKLAFEPPSYMIALGHLMRFIYPKFSQPNKLDIKALSRDPEVVEAYAKDPLVVSVITAATGVDVMKWGDWLDKYTGTIGKPTLVMHGDADRVTNYENSKAFAERQQGNIQFKGWPGLYHEIHNEPEQEQVMDFALNWMNKIIHDYTNV